MGASVTGVVVPVESSVWWRESAGAAAAPHWLSALGVQVKPGFHTPLNLWVSDSAQSVSHFTVGGKDAESVAWFMLRWLLFMSSGVQLRGRLVFVTSSSSSAVGCQPAQSEARMQRRRRVLQCCPEYAATRQGPAVQTGQSLQLLCAGQLYPSPKFVPVCVIPQVKVNLGN